MHPDIAAVDVTELIKPILLQHAADKPDEDLFNAPGSSYNDHVAISNGGWDYGNLEAFDWHVEGTDDDRCRVVDTSDRLGRLYNFNATKVARLTEWIQGDII